MMNRPDLAAMARLLAQHLLGRGGGLGSGENILWDCHDILYKYHLCNSMPKPVQAAEFQLSNLIY